MSSVPQTNKVFVFNFEVSDLAEVSFALVREVWTHPYLALHLGTDMQLAVLPTLPRAALLLIQAPRAELPLFWVLADAEAPAFCRSLFAWPLSSSWVSPFYKGLFL